MGINQVLFAVGSPTCIIRVVVVNVQKEFIDVYGDAFEGLKKE